MNRLFGMPQFRAERLSLAEPGAEGGNGGGGSLQPKGPTLPPLAQTVARQEMENGLASSDPNSGGEGTRPEGGQGPEKESPPAGVKPDSEEPSKAKTKPKGEEGKEEPADPETRVNHAKARMHAAATKAAQLEKEMEVLRKELAEAKSKVDLANKYVDWDKLSAYDKEQMETELGRPLTRKDLEELKNLTSATPEKKAGTTAAEAKGGEAENAQKVQLDKFVEKFLTENPHVLRYIETGEADGVVFKLSAKIDESPEWAKKTDAERLNELGRQVGEFFRKRDAERAKESDERLTTRRASLEQGGLPRAAGGVPPPTKGEEETDDPSAYIAERQARQARMFSPSR